ncbi:MAG: HlyD family efflux transporter periplasmic adaptor subunit [Candidatus Eisenbacteria bacterium]|uniref:HlyD family efflux transporter periplasmic adaptor subunit n=1 Tax=Eiseniibacteriota bacterium TaxID=2212470 RepID=A0A538T758_UNCEI|nr:MAG: HlyD family efflux transporter periplasmic adaptor subunit [Candidatus Eisenbacteria bacterium]
MRARPPGGASRSASIAFSSLGGALILAAALAGCSNPDRGIRGSGTIELDEVDIASLVGGRVSLVTVEEGDSVRAGDTLAVLAQGEVTAGVREQEAEAERARALARDQELGPRPEERRAARADLDTAEAALKLAENDLNRVRALFVKQLIAQSDLDRAQAQRDQAAARRDAAAERSRLLEAGYRRQVVAAARHAAEAASAGLASARSRAHELVLTAPIAGVVLLKNVEEGEVIGPGIPILTLGDPAKLWLRVYVPAPQLTKVRLGDRVEVRVLGERRAFTGRVVEIATRAEFTPRAALTEEERANIVFGVKVALDPGGGILKPGLPADARILAGR